MSWSWLGLFFGLVLPPTLFWFAYFRRIKRESVDPRLLGAFVIGGALLASLTAVLFVFYVAPQWTQGVRIVWTDMRTGNVPLTIGGDPNDNTVGWPVNAEGATSLGPMLRVDANQGNQAQVILTGGNGFIYDPAAQKLLNGTPVSIGNTVAFGAYSIRVNHLGWTWRRPFTNPFRKQLEVIDSVGNIVAGFNLVQDRTRSLEYLLPANLDPKLFTKEQAGQRDQIEEWATGIWLLRIDDERVYVLEKTSRNEMQFDLPRQLSLVVRWPNLSLPFELDLDRQNIRLSFQSPWRFSSPLPPKVIDGCQAKEEKNNELKVVVTSQPRPCTISLTLPFGAQQENLNQEVAIDPVTRKFTSPGSVDNDKPLNCPPGANCPTTAIGRSQYAVSHGNHTFGLAIAEDMPSLRWCIVLLTLSLIYFGWGLWLLSDRIPRTNLWLIYGLVLVLWNLLTFRLILSFRYALDPAALDALAVSGVTRALFALMIIPGFLLFLARIRCDHYERPALQRDAALVFRKIGLYFLALWIAFPLAYYLPSYLLWPNLPDAYQPSLTRSVANLGYVIGLWLAPFLLIATYLIKLYGPRGSESVFLKPWRLWTKEDLSRQNTERKGSRRSSGHKPAAATTTLREFVHFGKDLLLYMWQSITLSLLLFSPWRWAEQSHFKKTSRLDAWKSTISTWRGLGRYLALFTVRLVVFMALCFGGQFVVKADKLIQELAVPVFFYWLAIDWIGLAIALKEMQGHEKLRWAGVRIALLAIVTISIPAVLIPAFALFDFGSALAVLAILFPLTAVVLLIGNERFRIKSPLKGKLRFVKDRRAGLAMVLALVALFMGGYFFYENLTGFTNIPLLNTQGRVFARLLNFKHGSQAQRWALTANSAVGGEGVPFQELLNGNQHAWETKAIAHLGGWTGEGFGKAPTRLSHVRQDTLQYDSAFSFFVVSEYGFIGGCLLLLMFVVPLLLVLIGAREHLDAGYALALVVASSFLIEALYHAGMNWGVFPITGRNLPLLSVNSPTDLLKWTVLFGFLLQSVFWRYQGSACITSEAKSILPDQGSAEEDISDGVRVRGWQLVTTCILILLFPFVTLTSVVVTGFHVTRDVDNEYKTFSYKPLLDDAKWYLDNRAFEYLESVPGAGRSLVVRPGKLNDPDAQEFILQEVYRFNARNEENRIEAQSTAQVSRLKTGLAAVHDLRTYNGFLLNLRSSPSTNPRPGLFRLAPVRDENGDIADYRVEVNDDFNVRFRFRHQNDPQNLPRLRYGDAVLIGPGWINGRYATLIARDEDLAHNDPRAPFAELPWAGHLAAAMESEWHRLGATEAAKAYPALTLNAVLQKAAGEFMAAKGMALHEELLGRPAHDYREKLPPRVALSIVSLVDGKVLALGSWPRMTTNNARWKQITATREGSSRTGWIPNSSWLENDAPIALKRRYEGDRNFERALVMGSITKPIWASAVLKIHPNLDQLLRVMPSSGNESEVFGLTVSGSPWNLNSHTKDWVTFDQYLRYSDNRYHVRTGFLGLAEKEGNAIKRGVVLGSPVESLNGQSRSWGYEPQFSSAVIIDPSGARRIDYLNLSKTELGNHLHDMYSIGVVEQKNWKGWPTRAFSYRRSFWTLNERDDDSRFEPKTSWLLDLVSPQVPDFYFDRLTNGRFFVNLLLGGGDNRWSNVDLAGAFGSCITGRPVIPHIIDRPTVVPSSARSALDPAIAVKIRRGLNQAVEQSGGTANALWQGDDLGFLKSKVKFYAKTGTLKPEGTQYETSRIAVTLINWNGDKISAGLVFTVVAEQGSQGTATRWLKQFLIENTDEIAKVLNVRAR